MISIVTAYYNRKQQFLKTLETISKSSIKDFEFIVVDDGSDVAHLLDDVVIKYPFIKLIRIEKQNKWYINSVVPFNIGIKAAKGDIIILQNPECLHTKDILSYVTNHITEENCLSMACYSIDEASTQIINNYEIDLFAFVTTTASITKSGGFKNTWFNHSVINPTGHHFCMALTKKNIQELGGFDERFAHGVAYDDSDLVRRIKRKNLKLVIVDDFPVIHQWHTRERFTEISDYKNKLQHNKKLFEVTNTEKLIKANE